jgi:hypothetical protein
MKKLTSIFSICAMLLAGNIATAGCGGCCDGGKDKAAGEKHADAPAQVYTCEMHPEVVSDKPGKCPKCGMTLIPKKDEAKKS